MTDQITRKELKTAEPTSETSRDRRTLLKGAACTLPMILTLQSGAALARSSNLITSASPESSKDKYGRTLCMDGDTVYAARSGESGVYDLGEPPYARVAAINDRTYVSYSSVNGAVEVTEPEMCERGGVYYYKRRWGWRQVHVKQGMLVSATALSSFAGKIDLVDI